MKIAVVGAGGVGGYFGGRLAQAGVDTTFVVRGRTLDTLLRDGLKVDSFLGNFHLDKVNATDDPGTVGPVDAVLMTVKSWQVPEAAAQIRPLVGPDTMVVPLENGIDAPDVLATILGAPHVLGGLCAIVSMAVAPGHIRHLAFEPLVMFGELDNPRTERVERLRATFEQAGINAEIPPDIQRSMWTKFLFIATMSAIGALTRVPIGVWRVSPQVRLLVDASLREIVELAKARGVDPGEDAVAKTWERYDALAPASTSSMQRDIMEGKPSELDAQLGAVVRLAKQSGVATPVTDTLYHLLEPQERAARGL